MALLQTKNAKEAGWGKTAFPQLPFAGITQIRFKGFSHPA